MALLVLPVLTEGVGESLGLLLSGEPRKQIGMAGREFFLLESLCHLGDERKQGQTGVDVALALAAL